jgi:peroxiredoxin
MLCRMRNDLKPGAAFPDLELPDHAGNTRRLSELAGGDPLVLTFYRGWWCPKEQAFFRRLVEFQDEVEVAYTRLVSVSVDAPEVAAAFRAGLGARWTFLSDVERRYVAELDLLETTDTLHEPYVPTVFTLSPDLAICSAWNGYWAWGRPSLEELRRDLRAITKAIRPDWEVPPPSRGEG